VESKDASAGSNRKLVAPGTTIPLIRSYLQLSIVITEPQRLTRLYRALQHQSLLRMEQNFKMFHLHLTRRLLVTPFYLKVELNFMGRGIVFIGITIQS
jgi:hypothetical protein